MLQQLRLKMDILRLCATQQTYARPKKLFFANFRIFATHVASNVSRISFFNFERTILRL